MSLAEQLAVLPDEERDEILEELAEEDNDWEYSPEFWLRPNQLECLRDEHWLIGYLAGRGAGKTHTGSDWTIEKAKVPGTRIHLVGRTVGDVRDVMIQGDSGILAHSPPSFKPDYIPSVRKLVWPNGSTATTFSADAPSQLRGPQSHVTWADEVAAWKHVPDDSGATAWDNVLISTRLGDKPQILVTTTPKRIAMIKDIVARSKNEPEHVSIHVGSTFDNAANLSAEYLTTLTSMYAGTALERQELFGELLLVVEGALWQDDDFRYATPPIDTDLITIVAVDPSASSKGDATGIMVIQASGEKKLMDRHAWVRVDATMSGPPEKWGGVVHDLQREWSRPGRPAIVVAEKNQGGEMVSSVLHQHDPGMPVALIHAARSKAVRAEPVVLTYRQRRVWHSDEFEELQEELTTWEPGSRWSPNRLDALVHGITAVLIDDKPLRRFGTITAGEDVLSQSIPGAITPQRRERGKNPFGAWRRR
jgi:phage terminase large subunit-like protein